MEVNQNPNNGCWWSAGQRGAASPHPHIPCPDTTAMGCEGQAKAPRPCFRQVSAVLAEHWQLHKCQEEPVLLLSGDGQGKLPSFVSLQERNCRCPSPKHSFWSSPWGVSGCPHSGSCVGSSESVRWWMLEDGDMNLG